MFKDPVAHLLQFVRPVVLVGDQQVGDLEPDIGFVLEPGERVEDGLEVREGQVLVEQFGEGLQVDVGGIEAFENGFPGDVGDVAGGDRHGLQATLVAGLGGIDGVLGPDHRVVVGEGDAAAAGGHGRLGDGLGRGLFTETLDFT